MEAETDEADVVGILGRNPGREADILFTFSRLRFTIAQEILLSRHMVALRIKEGKNMSLEPVRCYPVSACKRA